jgi:hypothetical protein
MGGVLTAFIAAARSGAAAAAAETDPYFKFTTLLLPGSGTHGAQNNTFLDSSVNTFAITRNGNTTQGAFSPFSPTGWSIYFNGTTDYLTAPSNAAFGIGAGDYTFECWVYKQTASRVMLCAISSAGLSVSINASGNIEVNRALTAIDFTFTAAIQNNEWTHVAVTRSGTSLRAFKNGTLLGTQTSSTSYGQGNCYICADADTSSKFFGYISNFRIVKGSAVYTANFTPATAPLSAIGSTSLLTCQSNRFVDNSSNNFTLTVTGTPSVQAFSPFAPTAAYSPAAHGGSGYFDGAGDYLTATSTSGQLGAGNFTIECWVYLLGRVTSSPCIFGNYSAFAAGSFGLFAGHHSGDVTKYQLAINGAFPAIQSTNSIVYNSWTHLAVVRNASVITLYINGVANGTTSTSATLNGTNGTAWIGTSGDSLATGYLQGYLCGLSIVPNSAIYTASFTPPTAPLTAIANTSLLLNFTNAGIIDATAKNNLETVGNAQISTTQTKWGGGSMFFDGAGDYLTIPSTQNVAFGTNDFTIELWAFLTDVQYKGIFQSSSNPGGLSTDRTTGVGISLSGSQASGLISVTVGNTIFQSPANTITSQSWYHIAVTRSSGFVRLFLNGILQSSGAASANCSGTYAVIGGEYSENFLYMGYIQDLRITKGYARYTTNFAPPLSAFLRQ